MRAISLIRAALILMVCGSIAVAGTAVVWSTGERVISSVVAAADALGNDALQPVQAGEIDKQLRNYRIRLRADGKLPGRINVIDPATGEVVPARNMQIALLQRGRVVAEFRPGIDGVFEVEGIAPGIYSLIGHGDEGMIAYGMEVMPSEYQVDNSKPGIIHPVAYQEIQSELQIDSLAVPPADGPSVLDLASRYLPADVVDKARQSAGASAGPSAEAAPAAPAAEARADIDPTEDNPANEAVPAASLRRFAIRLGAHGTLTGRMRTLNPQSGQPARFRRLNVFLVKDNEIVGQAPVDPLGAFTFPDLQPGYYSFIAAGTDGFTAFSIRTVTEDVAGLETLDELTVPVAFTQLPPGGAERAQQLIQEVFGVTVDIEDVPYILDWLYEHYPPPSDDNDDGAGGAFGAGGGPPNPFAPGEPLSGYGGGGSLGGGGVGGAAGGGGGLLGGGGLGELLGLAALVAAGVAISESQDSDNPPTVISQSAPQ